MTMRTIDDLVEHINKYKDSVIIVGKYINDKLINLLGIKSV